MGMIFPWLNWSAKNWLQYSRDIFDLDITLLFSLLSALIPSKFIAQTSAGFHLSVFAPVPAFKNAVYGLFAVALLSNNLSLNIL